MNQLVAGSGLNEIAIASIQAEAKKIANAGHYTDSQQAYGILASLLGDEDEVKRRFDAALAHAGHNPAVQLNYMVSLANVHDYYNAITVADEILDTFLDDIEALRKILRIYISAFKFDKTDEIVGKLLALGVPQDDQQLLAILGRINAKQEMLERAGATYEQACERIRTVYHTIRDLGHRSYSITETVCFDSILLEFAIDTDLETLATIDAAISDKIASMPYLPIDRVLTFSCAIRESNLLLI